MAGVYTHPAYQGAQPWRERAAAPVRARAGLQFPPGRGWAQVIGAPRHGDLAGLGAAVGPSAPLYAAVSFLGATAGGMTVGYVASSGEPRAAVTGGLFTAGLAGLADTPMLFREGHPYVGTLSGILGILAMGGAIRRAFYR